MRASTKNTSLCVGKFQVLLTVGKGPLFLNQLRQVCPDKIDIKPNQEVEWRQHRSLFICRFLYYKYHYLTKYKLR